MPGNGPEYEKGLTYSVRHKGALFLALDEYYQKKDLVLRGYINQPWLSRQLETQAAPFIFAFCHTPAYQVVELLLGKLFKAVPVVDAERHVVGIISDGDLLQIIELLIGMMNQNLAQKNISISLSPEAARWILEKTCTDRSYGARPLRRALQADAA